MGMSMDVKVCVLMENSARGVFPCDWWPSESYLQLASADTTFPMSEQRL